VGEVKSTEVDTTETVDTGITSLLPDPARLSDPACLV